MRTKRIDQEVFDILTRQFERGKGMSRHTTKKKGVFSAQSNKIHSKTTFKTYRQQSKAFCRYARETLDIHKFKDVSAIDVRLWLEDCQSNGDSPYTLKTRAAAMAKVLQCNSTDFGFDFPLRKSENIKRSRGTVKSDERLDEEKYAGIITVAKGTGMRRIEMKRLKKEQLEIRDGQAYITEVHGKGDLIRTIPVLKKYNDAVIEIIQKSKTKKVFPDPIQTHIDIHSYRGGYAKAMYDQILAEKKKNGEEVKSDYHTRGEVKISVNRAVVAEVSKTLGHTRINVTITHYLKHHFA